MPAAPVPPRDAYDQALRILGRRSYTSHEVRLRLMRKQFPGAEIEAALDRLRAAGFLDDVALLDALVRRRRRALRALAEPVQRRRLYGFLARRGYSADVIARALDAKT